ncbi:MAG: hypothetical protein HYY67_06770 [Thaumarchaeota archaeon]|nr:hypothetical protein [Nitrososphaerota archaeon]
MTSHGVRKISGLSQHLGGAIKVNSIPRSLEPIVITSRSEFAKLMERLSSLRQETILLRYRDAELVMWGTYVFVFKEVLVSEDGSRPTYPDV